MPLSRRPRSSKYQLTCLLSTKVYEKHLHKQQLSLDKFCKFTDVFYGVNYTIPHEILQMMWGEHNLTHQQCKTVFQALWSEHCVQVLCLSLLC